MIQAIRGAKDILPDSIALWQFAEKVFRKISTKYGYSEFRTPIFEKTEVFSRSIGEQTDIVNKEMYTFNDRAGESITLRPEMTAAIVRSAIQNSLLAQNPLLKVWYFGPFFRYERPQKGRLRQFHQFGSECIGSPYPESDAENILLADGVIKSLGIGSYKLLLNTLGNDAVRANYRNALIDFLKSKSESLSGDSQIRLESNPLRVLDSKDPADKAALEGAPVILDFLDDESRIHFDSVKSILSSAGIEFSIDPKLVRGLDYYCHTVFEFQSDALGAQDSFGGGGRYNTLFSQLGGKDVPAVGFAMGVERLLLILEETKCIPDLQVNPEIFIVTGSDKCIEAAIVLSRRLRKNGYYVVSDLHRRSMKAQFRDANKLGVKYCVIIGEDELAKGAYQLKNMNTGEQKELSADDLISLFAK